MRCQRLNQDGRRCKRQAVAWVTMHQGEETYGMEPHWAVVAVCGHHGEGQRYGMDDEEYENLPVQEKNKL